MFNGKKKLVLFDVAGTLLSPAEEEAQENAWKPLRDALRNNEHLEAIATSSPQIEERVQKLLRFYGAEFEIVIKNCSKDWLGFYLQVAKHYSMNVEDIVLVDDGRPYATEENNANIQAARKAGAIGIHYTSIENTYRQMEELGIL